MPSMPRYQIGIEVLSVARDNAINANLFIGRIIHFSMELYRLHDRGTRYIEALRCTSHMWDCGVSADDAVSSVQTICSAWYEHESEVLGRSLDQEWLGEAKEALADFLPISYYGENRRPTSRVGALADMNPLEYLAWVDRSASGGPSAELMCFLNPFWRQAGFIYGSPFDGVMSIRPEAIRSPFSEVGDLHVRGLYPPRRRDA